MSEKTKYRVKVFAALLFLAVVNPATISVAAILVVKPELFSHNQCEQRSEVYHCKMPKLDK
jgi:hypothetical protein